MAPELLFGTASFGMNMTEFQDRDSAIVLFNKLHELGIGRLDTAARYPPLRPGRSEELIGEAMDSEQVQNMGILVDTKVYTNTVMDGSGDLGREAFDRSLVKSLERFGQRENGSPPINVLYIHRPDPSTPLEEQIQAFNEQITKGTIKSWGVSNMPPDLLTKVLDLCEQNNWQKPSCYQGRYNLISRGPETKLFPILRRHNISFVAYHTLGAGFLTAKYVTNQHAGTRFDDKNPLGKFAQNAFADDTVQNALKTFDTKVKAAGLTSIEVALRLTVHQLALQDNDAVILGASKTAQIEETARMIRKGPLPGEIVALAEEL